MVDPFRISPDDIQAEDIAASLSKLCRFGGHCRRFYSVAEHSVLLWQHGVVQELSPVEQLCLLLHDGSEAYMCDLPRPIKHHLPQYQELEERVQQVVALKFGLPYPFPAIVHEYDGRILIDERTRLMTINNNVWPTDVLGPLEVTIRCWDPDEARSQFLQAFSTAMTVANRFNDDNGAETMANHNRNHNRNHNI